MKIWLTCSCLILILAGCEDTFRVLYSEVVAPHYCAETNHTASGTGTMGDPYIICSPYQLKSLADTAMDWNRYYRLANDIDMSYYYAEGGAEFVIGDCLGSCLGNPGFSGIFEGNNKTIANFKFKNNSFIGAGFIGHLEGGTIRDITFQSVDIEGSDSVGGIVGFSSSTMALENVTVSGTVVGNNYVGGVIGQSLAISTILNSVSSANVSGATYVGGIAGFLNGNIEDSHSAGTLTGTAGHVGGIVGYTVANLETCYSTATVVSDGSFLGGLVGEGDSGHIYDSHFTGSISGIGTQVGGLIGSNNGPIRRSYVVGTIAGSGAVGGLVGTNNSSIHDSYARITVTGTTGIVGGLIGSDSAQTIVNVYSTGSVTTSNIAGGLIGRTLGANLSNAFSTVNISNATSSGRIVGNDLGGSSYTNVVALTSATCPNTCDASAETATTSSVADFYDDANAPLATGWNFSTVWIENASDFPTLQ